MQVLSPRTVFAGFVRINSNPLSALLMTLNTSVSVSTISGVRWVITSLDILLSSLDNFWPA